MSEIKVAELFAGVGGFRIGLESASRNIKSGFKVVWSNQWEPGESKQYASKVYEARWPKSNHSNDDISTVDKLPVKADLLVGGFPCQDYSVAKSLSQAQGISGKKGVLWWEIHRLLSMSDVPTVLLENVDRLLSSPARQRGRDFALMLASLNDLGYVVEWRVINAAEYGYPQKRKRVFIFAYKSKAPVIKQIVSNTYEWLTSESVFAQAFPVKVISNLSNPGISSFSIEGDLLRISKNFSVSSKTQKFQNTGLCVDRKVVTLQTKPDYLGQHLVLKDIILPNSAIPSEYFIQPEDVEKWERLKRAKSIQRTSKNGTNYHYSEGNMAFPDLLNKPARTIVTGEGGKSPSRFKHVISVRGKLRRLVPEELELLNGFPAGHSSIDGISDIKRAFFMGNALVTGVVKDFGIALLKNKATYY